MRHNAGFVNAVIMMQLLHWPLGESDNDCECLLVWAFVECIRVILYGF